MRTKAGHHDLPFAASRSPILQFRIELLGIQPLIWRRIQVPGEYTFWDLYVAIQSAFAWNDSHLHEFKVTNPERQPDLLRIAGRRGFRSRS
jgi:hypothetical protein